VLTRASHKSLRSDTSCELIEEKTIDPELKEAYIAITAPHAAYFVDLDSDADDRHPPAMPGLSLEVVRRLKTRPDVDVLRFIQYYFRAN
jgi:hypothetical protein